MRYIAYYRVSTQKQGRSGLGLDDQRQLVQLTLRAIAEQLNQHGFRTRYGQLLRSETVRRILKRTD